MLKTGMCLCHVCAGVSRRAFYYNEQKNIALELKQDMFGKYFPVPQDEHRNDDCRLDQPSGYRNERPVELLVTVNNEDTLKFFRVCPYCLGIGKTLTDENNRTITYLNPGQGEYPTFVIMVAGLPEAGKSTWCEAIRFAENYSSLNEHLKKKLGDRMTFQPVELSNQYVAKTSTTVGSCGKSAQVDICRERCTALGQSDSEKIASLLFIDMAGELYANRNNQSVTQGRFFAFADAVVVIDSADPAGQGSGQDVVKLYNNLRAMQYLKKSRPVAHVITCLDLLAASEKTKETPLLDDSTFGRVDTPDAYSAKKLLPRIALENHIVKQLRSAAGIREYLSTGNRCGFLVQNCRTAEDGSNDLTSSVNVMDPIVWLMNEFGLWKIA